ncbi:MAG: AEC family transporter, partial [Spirochaetaceae bacterium]
MEHIGFAINSVVPSFFIITLGIVLKKMKVITEEFIKLTSNFVFLVCIPCLVFRSISKSDFYQIFSTLELVLLLSSIIVVFFISWALSAAVVKERNARGAFIQGSFRSNFAIIGLAVMGQAFGEAGLRHGSILLAFALPAYNMLSIVALTWFSAEKQEGTLKKVAYEIIRNPLIIAVACAMPFALFQRELSGLAVIPVASNVVKIFDDAISQLGAIALPLSLVSIGATLRFQRAGKSLWPALVSSFIKVIAAPALIIAAALFLGIRGEALGILFILTACPTAVASFAMAQSMGSDRELAAEIIVFTTVTAVFTLSAGIAILAATGLI